MKCPFRKKIVEKDGVKVEEFENCYGQQCHAYSQYEQCMLCVKK